MEAKVLGHHGMRQRNSDVQNDCRNRYKDFGHHCDNRCEDKGFGTVQRKCDRHNMAPVVLRGTM